MIKDKYRYYFKDEEGTTSEVIFNITDDVMRITSVKTREDSRGKGLPKLLLEELVKNIKQNNYKVIPICSYSIMYFEKNEHLKYLLAK